MTSYITRKKWSLLAFLLLAVVLLFCALMPHSQIAAYAKYTQEVTPDSIMSVTLKGGPLALLPNGTWYKGTTEKSAITEIHVVQKMPSDVVVLEQWDASSAQNEGIMASITNDGVLYISLEGAEKAYLNEDSANAFSGFSNVESITGLELLDASNTVNFSNMFAGCGKLELLDLTKWNVGKVWITQLMFADCVNLESVNLGNWTTTNLTTVDDMFYNAPKLQQISVGAGVSKLIHQEFPIPVAENISGADGKWYAESSCPHTRFAGQKNNLYNGKG